MLKRFVDLVLAIPLLIASIPVMLAAILAVRLVDRGPMFFGHSREGLGGKTFRMWKIRTMTRDAEALLAEYLARNPQAREEWEARMKLSDDPRVVPVVGKFLRRFSVDELPQLWNVIRGDMSLVGPRPFPDYHNEKFPEGFRYLRREVLPGVTGYWQITTRSNGGLENQVQADRHYIENWSLWADFKILLRTVPVVFRGDGAF